MLSNPGLNINSEKISDEHRNFITKAYLAELNYSTIDMNDIAAHLDIKNLGTSDYKVDLSVKLKNSHIGIQRIGKDLTEVIKKVFLELKKNFKILDSQKQLSLFQFDQTTECHFFEQIKDLIPPLHGPSVGSVMILEDDEAARMTLEFTMQSLGWDVCGLSIPDDALKFFSVKSFNLLILDWNLPYKRGDEFLKEVDQFFAQRFLQNGINLIFPVIICSSMSEDEMVIPENLKHFQIIKIWHKSIPFSSLLNQLDLTSSQIIINETYAK